MSDSVNDFERVSEMSDGELEDFFTYSFNPVAKMLWMIFRIVAKGEADTIEFMQRRNDEFAVTVREGLDSWEMIPPARHLGEGLMALLANMLVVKQGLPSKLLHGSINFTVGSEGRLCKIWLGGSMVSQEERRAFERHIQLLLAAVVHRQQREEKAQDTTLTTQQSRIAHWRWAACTLGAAIVVKTAGYFLGWLPW